MTDNVVGLFGGDGGDGEGREPDARIVEVLENALRRAKEGEVQDMLLVYRYGSEVNPLTEKAWTASNLEVLGAIHLAASTALLEMCAMFQNMGETD